MAILNTYKLKLGQKFYCFVKAIMDFLIALIDVIVLCPLFVIVAIAIKIDSPGSIFFVQKESEKTANYLIALSLGVCMLMHGTILRDMNMKMHRLISQRQGLLSPSFR